MFDSMDWILDGIGYFLVTFGLLIFGSLAYHYVIEPIIKHFDIHIGSEKKRH